MSKIVATKSSISILVNGVLISSISVSSVVTEFPAEILPPRKEENNDVYVMQG
jgi:hypothetical protein